MQRFIAVLTVLVLATFAGAADFHVAPSGNDAASGAADQPFATVQRAVKAVRELRATQPDRDKPVVVAIRGGTYRMTAPIVLEPADSGTEKSPTIYQAAGGERPVLSGGVAITGWQVGDDGRWRVTLDAVKKGEWDFAQLFVNNQRRNRPRVPATGYFNVETGLEPTEASGRRGYDQFIFAAGDIKADYANRGDIEVYILHRWTGSRLRIAEVDAAARRVRFTGTSPSPSKWSSFDDKNRYYLENVKEALDAPGEWYLDRPTGVLTYIPRDGEKPDSTEVIAARLKDLVRFAGDAQKQQYVEHVQFKGLDFAHSNWSLAAEGHSFPQAEVNLGAAISGVGARHVVIEDCVVRHVGEYAIAFGAASRNCRIERCEMIDMGAGGVKIGIGGGPGSWSDFGGDWAVPEHRVSHMTVRDCTIAHGGRLHPAAVGVWIGHADHNTIEHNDIFDLYYTGISVGWTWGYHEPSRAHHNTIAFNHVHTIGQNVLSDMGGIYTLGLSPGTVVRNNIFHDIDTATYGGWGLYTDEGSSDIVMENNLIYNAETGSFHQHYGRNNIIRNNLMIESKLHQVQRTRTEDHLSFTFTQNIVYWTNDSPLLGSNWRDDNFKIDRNLYWNPNHTIKFFGDLTLEQWREKRKQDQNSIIADPLFVDAANGDFRLKPESPAKQIGFVEFDYSKAGRTTPRTMTSDLPTPPRTFD